MKPKNKISDYLLSNRKGKIANRLEREALSDPFLYEALEGLTEVEGDHLNILVGLDRKLRRRVGKYVGIGVKGWGVVAALAAIGIMCWVMLPLKQKTEQLAEPIVAADTADSPVHTKEAQMSAARAKALPSNPVENEKIEGETPDIMPEPIETSVPMAKDPLSDNAKVVIVNAGNNGPLPVDGVESFNNYIKKSLRYPEDALREKLEGDIKVSFIVNENGRPSRIRVLEWISYSCNREAIRLLEDGPVWTYTGAENPTYVIIPFRLKK